jgi:hypothetical protein
MNSFKSPFAAKKAGIAVIPGKAAVNTPHSKRYRDLPASPNRAKRLECGGFSTALCTNRPNYPKIEMRAVSIRFRLAAVGAWSFLAIMLCSISARAGVGADMPWTT